MNAFEMEQTTKTLRRHAHALLDTRDDFVPLMEQIGDKPIVLLGESTHGTHEFYRCRMLISQMLIEEKGFSTVALEADWPDCLHINRYLHSHDSDSRAVSSLAAFKRFPQWMWRNSDFLEMVEWLYVHNRKETTSHRVSVFGLDLYSLYTSIREVVHFLERTDPEAARDARTAYACFDHYERDPVRYGRAIRIGTKSSCETEAVRLLMELNQKLIASLGSEADDAFYAKQNALVVKDAEQYYRQLFNPFENTWNLRDMHMADTVDAIRAHLRAQGRSDKLIIWAHNSHVGDDRASEMHRKNQISLGQVLRERHPGETYHLGFTTYSGCVQAADEWDEPPMIKEVNPALVDSWESLLHSVSINRGPKGFFIDLQNPDVKMALPDDRLERAIGVIYSPESERLSHYFHSKLCNRFDAVIHFDHTMEVEPIDRLITREEEVAPPSHLQL